VSFGLCLPGCQWPLKPKTIQRPFRFSKFPNR